MSNYALIIFPTLVESIIKGLSDANANPKKCWVSCGGLEMLHTTKFDRMNNETKINFVKKFVLINGFLDSPLISARFKEQGTRLWKTFYSEIEFSSDEEKQNYFCYKRLVTGCFDDCQSELEIEERLAKAS
jgi:hypothetical protein